MERSLAALPVSSIVEIRIVSPFTRTFFAANRTNPNEELTSNTSGSPPLALRSLMRHDFARQSEPKGCAARAIGRRPQSAAMRLDNGPADRQSHARALRLGGKECIKDLVRLVCGQPRARIAHGDQQLTIFCSL